MTNPTKTPAERPPLYIYHVEINDCGNGLVVAAPSENDARECGLGQAIEDNVDDDLELGPGDGEDEEADAEALEKYRAGFMAGLKVKCWGVYTGRRGEGSCVELLRTCEV